MYNISNARERFRDDSKINSMNDKSQSPLEFIYTNMVSIQATRLILIDTVECLWFFGAVQIVEVKGEDLGWISMEIFEMPFGRFRLISRNQYIRYVIAMTFVDNRTLALHVYTSSLSTLLLSKDLNKPFRLVKIINSFI